MGALLVYVLKPTHTVSSLTRLDGALLVYVLEMTHTVSSLMRLDVCFAGICPQANTHSPQSNEARCVLCWSMSLR